MQVAGPELGRQKGAHAGSRRSRDTSRQGPWRCSNCPKEFAQKEYRYKHQQRCIQASNRQKLSKQKSCVACAASKLGCDLRTPSCSRCVNRNKRCQYVISTSDASDQGGQDRNRQEQQRNQSLDFGSQVRRDQFLFFDNEKSQNAPSQDPNSDTHSDLDTNMRSSTEPDNADAASNLRALSQLHQQQQQQQQQLQHQSAPVTNLNFGSWPMQPQPVQQGVLDQLPDASLVDPNLNPGWLRQKSFSYGPSGSETDESAARWQRSTESWLTRDPFVPTDSSIPTELGDGLQGNSMLGFSNDDLNFDLLGSLGILTRNRIVPAPTVQQSPFTSMLQTPASTSSRPSIASPSDTMVSPRQTTSNGPGADDETRVTLHDAVKTTYREVSALPGVAERGRTVMNERLLSCPFHKLHSDDDLVRIVCGYPRVMVRPGVYPPFVHHKLYRCSAGDIAEPLAKAFCCVGAFYASVPTSETFVYSLMNEESSKLVKGFHQWPGSDSDMLAVVHAMCIYQILGFFVSSSPDQARSTELQHLFFLKMTRRLIKQYLQSATGEDSEEVNWRKWIINETIRRTVFLVNAINTLSCRIQKQDPYYFESLDDNLVLNMALPAPEAVWKASTAEEWMIAKSQLKQEELARSRLTVQQVVEQVSQNGGGLSRPGADGFSSVQYGQLDEFTRLVLATLSNQ